MIDLPRDEFYMYLNAYNFVDSNRALLVQALAEFIRIERERGTGHEQQVADAGKALADLVNLAELRGPAPVRSSSTVASDQNTERGSEQ